jgi:hypothetical protein
MSTDKSKSSGDSSDLAKIKNAFSSKVWSRALDARVRQHPKFFDFLWQTRFWWIVAAAITFILPVLENDNTLWLSYSRSTNLYGFDLLVPMLSSYTENNSVIYVSSFSINPMALIIYGLIVLHLYLLFVHVEISPRLTLWHGIIQTVLALLFPFLDIPVLTYILHNFNSYWHVQPPAIGFYVLVITGLALWGAAYGRILRGLPVPDES